MDHTTRDATSPARQSGVEKALHVGKNCVDINTLTPKNTDTSATLTAKECPKFNGCSAPQCPLIPSSLNTTYYSGEPLCFWLMEYGKEGGRTRIKQCYSCINLELVGRAYSKLLSTYGSIRIRLERASQTPSRLGGGS